jgi:hypothetical protein
MKTNETEWEAIRRLQNYPKVEDNTDGWENEGGRLSI